MPVERESQSNFSDSGTENDLETERTEDQEESVNEPFNLEEFVCPICIDYLIDVVETPCSHRFCCHCISQWVNINPQRKCPTCRTSMGLVARMPHLDDKITEALSRILDPIALSQREIVRSHRQSIDFPDDNNDNDNEEGGDSTNENDEALRDGPRPRSWTNQATDLIARIRETRRRVGDFQLHSTVANARNQLRVQTRSFRHAPSPRRIGSIRPTSRLNCLFSANRNSESLLFSTMTHPMREDLRRADVDIQEASINEGTTQLSSASTNSATQLLRDYTYHLRSAESAYSRIKDGIRDFEYHNSRLDVLFQDFTSLNIRRVSQQRIVLPRNVTQEDFRFSREAHTDNFRPLQTSTSSGLENSSLPTSQTAASGISRNPTQLVSEVDEMLATLSERLDLMRQISMNDYIQYPIESFERLQEILLQPRVRNQQQDRVITNTRPGLNFESNNETQTEIAPPPPRPYFTLQDHEYDTMFPSRRNFGDSTRTNTNRGEIHSGETRVISQRGGLSSHNHGDNASSILNTGAPTGGHIDARSQRTPGTEVGSYENIAGGLNIRSLNPNDGNRNIMQTSSVSINGHEPVGFLSGGTDDGRDTESDIHSNIRTLYGRERSNRGTNHSIFPSSIDQPEISGSNNSPFNDSNNIF